MDVELSEAAATELQRVMDAGRFECLEQALEHAVGLLVDDERGFWEDVSRKLADVDESLPPVPHEVAMERARALVHAKAAVRSART